MQSPKQIRQIQPPPLKTRRDWPQQVALVAAGTILLLALFILLLYAWPPRRGSTTAGNAPNPGDAQVASTSSGDGGSAKQATSSSSANTSNEAGIAAKKILPPRPSIEIGNASADGASPIDGQDQDSSGSSEVPPGDLAVQAEPARKPRQVVLGNFSSPGIEFFGARAVGNSIAFVVDISGSMGSSTTASGISNFELMKQELMRSVNSLEPNQTFTVVCYNDQAHSRQDLTIANATDESKEKLRNWLSQLSADGGTEPVSGMKVALKTSPDIVFLLSDGEFDWDCVRNIQSLNGKNCMINTVSMGMDARTLQQIATDSGGQFRVVN